MDESYLDRLKNKRQADADKKARQDELKQTTDSFEDSAAQVAAEVARQAAKTRTTTQKVSVDEDIVRGKDLDKIVDSINKMNLTSFIASKETWFSDLVDALFTLSKRMSAVAQDFDGNGVKSIEKSLSTAATRLEQAVTKIKTVKVETDDDVKTVLNGLREAIESFDYSPTVNVPAPNVTVTAPEVDLKPLQKSMDSYFTPRTDVVDLSRYRAQDMDEMEQGTQFVGFVNPEGAWYILKSVEEDNTLRYKFGKDKYPRAWERVSTFKYKLLNEAADEIQA